MTATTTEEPGREDQMAGSRSHHPKQEGHIYWSQTTSQSQRRTKQTTLRSKRVHSAEANQYRNGNGRSQAHHTAHRGHKQKHRPAHHNNLHDGHGNQPRYQRRETSQRRAFY